MGKLQWFEIPSGAPRFKWLSARGFSWRLQDETANSGPMDDQYPVRSFILSGASAARVLFLQDARSSGTARDKVVRYGGSGNFNGSHRSGVGTRTSQSNVTNHGPGQYHPPATQWVLVPWPEAGRKAKQPEHTSSSIPRWRRRDGGAHAGARLVVFNAWAAKNLAAGAAYGRTSDAQLWPSDVHLVGS